MIGGVGGIMEVCLMQPMVAFKNALQEGRPLPRTPTQMYRGLLVRRSARLPLAVLPPVVSIHRDTYNMQTMQNHTSTWHVQINCGSIAPITASQFGTNRFMEKLLTQRSGGEQLGTLGRFGCAAVAGTVSALVASPTELIIIQQQVNSLSCQAAGRPLRVLSVSLSRERPEIHLSTFICAHVLAPNIHMCCLACSCVVLRRKSARGCYKKSSTSRPHTQRTRPSEAW